MKRILIIAVMALMPTLLSGQSKSFMKFYDKYSGRSGYVTMEMSGSMFGAINVQVTDSGISDAVNISDQISNIVIVIAESGADHAEFQSDIDKVVSAGEYKSVLVVRDGGQAVRFYSIEKGDEGEFMMTVTGDGEILVMLLTGEGLTVEQVTDFGRGGR